MTIATVVTRGYGSFGSISDVTLRGYGIGAYVPPSGASGEHRLANTRQTQQTTKPGFRSIDWNEGFVQPTPEPPKPETVAEPVEARTEQLTDTDREIKDLLQEKIQQEDAEVKALATGMDALQKEVSVITAMLNAEQDAGRKKKLRDALIILLMSA